MRNFTDEEKKKLTQLIREGITVKQEVTDLNEGLKDTVNSIAEEMQIKSSILNKAIKLAHKGEIGAHDEDVELLDSILIATNHKNIGP